MRSQVKTRLVKLGLITACAVASVSATVAQSGPASPEEQAQKAVHLRQANFDLIEWNFAPIGAMLKNQMPFDAALVAKNAARIEALGTMVPELFATDTSKSAAKSKARSGIWTSAADFKAKNDDFVKAAAALTEAAKGGDKKAFQQAAVAVGKSCGACHDSFRDK